MGMGVEGGLWGGGSKGLMDTFFFFFFFYLINVKGLYKSWIHGALVRFRNNLVLRSLHLGLHVILTCSLHLTT